MSCRHRVFRLMITALVFFGVCFGRIHRLTISEDYRRFISITKFGFYRGGILDLKFKNFHYYPHGRNTPLFGFTLKKMVSDAMDPHTETYGDHCMLNGLVNNKLLDDDVMFFKLDLKNNLLMVNCTTSMYDLNIYNDTSSFPPFPVSEQISFENDMPSIKGSSCSSATLPVTKESTSVVDDVYNTRFVIFVREEKDEGLYELLFHNCEVSSGDPVAVSFSAEIEEHNLGNYLSAGEMPLPALYITMSVIFFLSAMFWVYILAKSRHPVFKIHYLMATLVFLKSLALLFHGINYHFIETKGEHVATWANLFYITRLLKGSVLFITIILIGTGWNFIKHILSHKDKKIFMIVIPLQVFANIAEIVIEETEEGDAEYKMWSDVFTFVDLVCCGTILFPIIWSIKHLQDASHIDGKALINLRKLKMFRHFYVMIVCYIYFTRIVVYLLKMTVPFQYEWLDEMFKEITTFVFFVLTGYKFRPASANPYFQTSDEEDSEMDIVVNPCSFQEGLTKLSKISNDTADDDKDTLLIYKRESSHDYD